MENKKLLFGIIALFIGFYFMVQNRREELFIGLIIMIIGLYLVLINMK